MMSDNNDRYGADYEPGTRLASWYDRVEGVQRGSMVEVKEWASREKPNGNLNVALPLLVLRVMERDDLVHTFLVADTEGRVRWAYSVELSERDMRSRCLAAERKHASAVRELDEFKEKVVEVAQQYADEHDWCDVVDSALDELGLDLQRKATITLTVEVDVEGISPAMRQRIKGGLVDSWIEESYQIDVIGDDDGGTVQDARIVNVDSAEFTD